MKIKKYQKGGWFSKLGDLMLQASTTSPTSVTGGDAYGARAMRAFSEGDVEKAKEIQREEDTKAAMAMGTAAIIPEMAVTGVVPTLVTTAAGLAGGYVGNKAGSYLDEKLDTKWIAPTLSIIGGLGSGIGSYKGLVNAGTKGLLKGNSVMYGKNFVSDVVATSLNKSVPTSATINSTVPIIRTKIGDIEIDDPNLYYRQGTHHIGDDLIKTGIVKEGTINNITPVKVNGIQLTKKQAFKAPMFSQGRLWYGLNDPIEYSDLIVAPPNANMRFATQHANPTTLLSKAGPRRIPSEQFTSEDVTLYKYIPGYGYFNRSKTRPTTSYKLYEQPSTYFKDAKYPTSSKSYAGKEVPAWQLPKGERNNVLNGHLKGDDAVLMFKQYGGDKFPENSAIKTQIEKLIPEARERYGLVGNTNITDDEIAGSLYKRAMELNGEGNAAILETGEPLLLFRGDTKRYSKLMNRISPEELVSKKGTMDNSLGTLFLDYPTHYQGVDRYLGTIRNFNGNWTINASGTGSKPIQSVSKLNIDSGDLMPKGTRLLYSGVFGKRNMPISVYKLPGNAMESGINDLNTFIVRTPNIRNSTKEISVLNDDWLTKRPEFRGKTKLIEDQDGFPLFLHEDGSTSPALAGMDNRQGMAEHYRSILNEAKAKNQGLLHSKAGADLRDEHTGYNYYALPNFNKQNAKHLFGWDLRNPADWTSDIIYKQQGGKLKLQSGNKITPEHARLLGRRGMPGDKEALAAAGYDSKGRPLVTFGGGSFGGAGAGVSFKDGIEQVENYDYVRNTPILQSFSDAFNNARKSGLSSFTFNGKEYTTEMSDNPNYIGKKYQPLLNIREILDKNMKVMSDSTRIEPYVGQIPGTHRRESSQ